MDYRVKTFNAQQSSELGDLLQSYLIRYGAPEEYALYRAEDIELRSQLAQKITPLFSPDEIYWLSALGNSDNAGLGHFRGVPVTYGLIEASPQSLGGSSQKVFLQDWFVFALCCLTKLDYSQQHSQNLTDKSAYTRVHRKERELDLHRDGNCSKKVITLSCIKSDKNALTAFLDLGDFAARHPREAMLLTQEKYYHGMSASLSGMGRVLKADFSDKTRKLVHAPSRHCLSETRLADISSRYPENEGALQTFRSYIRENMRELALERGDVIAWNNVNLWHGRFREYELSNTPTEARWLRRHGAYVPLHGRG